MLSPSSLIAAAALLANIELVGVRVPPGLIDSVTYEGAPVIVLVEGRRQSPTWICCRHIDQPAWWSKEWPRVAQEAWGVYKTQVSITLRGSTAWFWLPPGFWRAQVLNRHFQPLTDYGPVLTVE